jgi:hypothetical protein
MKYKRLSAKIMRQFIKLLADTWNSMECSQSAVDELEHMSDLYPTFSDWKTQNPQEVRDGMSRAFVFLYISVRNQ